MNKYQLLPRFVLVSMLLAGIFGALNDQISYTVSAEYYTRFKFLQFGLLDEALPERLRAAMVGFLASWWMGLPLGVLAGSAGFIHGTAAQMRRALRWSLLLIFCFAMLCALAGLLYGYLQTDQIEVAAYPNWFIPAQLKHLRSYLCAGYMHNAAYLGGLCSIPVAWIFHLGFRHWERT